MAIKENRGNAPHVTKEGGIKVGALGGQEWVFRERHMLYTRMVRFSAAVAFATIVRKNE